MKFQKVEWKDTNDQPYYLSYSFPISVLNRCWFFWTNTVKGWRKILNLANQMAFGNKMSVVFLYGANRGEALTNYIAKLNNPQLIVCQASYVSVADIDTVNQAEDWLKKNQASGYRAKDENKRWLFDVSETYKKYILQSQKQEYADFLYAKETVERIKELVNSKGFTVLNQVKQHHISGRQDNITKDLLEIVKELYPLGIEVDTEMEFAYKRVAVPKLIKLGLQKNVDDSLIEKMGIRLEKEQGLVQLSLFDDYSPNATELVNAIRVTCKKDIQTLGHINQFEVTTMLRNRPYGVYECNYYYYLLAYAYSEFTQGYYYGYGLTSYPIEKVELNRENILAPLIFQQTTKQSSLIEKLCKLFDITKRVETLQDAILWAIAWITENVHYDTIQRISPELFELFGGRYDVYSLATEQYDDYLDEQTTERLYRQLRNIDEQFIERVTTQYGETKARLLCKAMFVKGSARGWLHHIEWVDEQVEEYMKEVVCRECGKKISISGINTEMCHETIDYIDGELESRNWSLKEIIGINKKLLGRQQNEYYCVHCLSEMLDISEMELWEKMHEFKESGCTLF